MRRIEQFTVFVSSPGGLMHDRQGVEAACDEANRILSSEGLNLAPIFWERDIAPGRAGDEGQAVINQRLIQDVDIFVLLMHSKVGTATKVATSGTIEEFNIAHQISLTGGRHIEFCIYFNVSPVSPKSDLEQLRLVQDFRSRVESLGYLHRDYESVSDFKLMAVAHLVEKARALRSPEEPSTVRDPITRSELVSIGADGEVEEELGPLDYEEMAVEHINRASPLIEQIGTLASEYSKKLDISRGKLEQAAKYQKLGINVNRRELIDETAQLLMNHVNEVGPVINSLREELDLGLEASLGLVQEWDISSEDGEAAVRQFIDTVASSREQLRELSQITEAMLSSFDDWPGLTKLLKTAKRANRVTFGGLVQLASKTVSRMDEVVSVGSKRLQGD